MLQALLPLLLGTTALTGHSSGQHCPIWATTSAESEFSAAIHMLTLKYPTVQDILCQLCKSGRIQYPIFDVVQQVQLGENSIPESFKNVDLY